MRTYAQKPIAASLLILIASLFGASASQSQDAAPAALEKKVETGTPAVVLDDHGVESLLGKDVKNAAGDKLGRIVDVLVSNDGQIKAAVVDFGGFLGVGTRKVAVAWGTLRFAGDGPVLDMTSDALRVTPEYRAGEPVVVVGSPSAQAEQPASVPKPDQ